MLHFQIEFSSGLSVYRQLAEQIRFYIASETLLPGDKLPSVRGLSKELGINPATVVKAYGGLQSEGLIELRQGRGAFVTKNDLSIKEITKEHAEELAQKVKAVTLLASQLSMSEDELLSIVSKHYQEIKNV